MNEMVMAGIGLGIVVNLVALMALIYKFGSWSGKVTTLLDAHADNHVNHYSTAGEHGERLADLEGQLRNTA